MLQSPQSPPSVYLKASLKSPAPQRSKHSAHDRHAELTRHPAPSPPSPKASRHSASTKNLPHAITTCPLQPAAFPSAVGHSSQRSSQSEKSTGTPCVHWHHADCPSHPRHKNSTQKPKSAALPSESPSSAS